MTPSHRTCRNIDAASNLIAVQDAMVSGMTGVSREERSRTFVYGDRRLRALGFDETLAHKLAYDAFDMAILQDECEGCAA